MHRKSLVLAIVIGLSLAILETDVFAQRGGRGRGGAEPGAEGAQAPAAGRGRGGRAQAGGRFGGGQAVNPLFAALDANGDGVITTAEMEDAIQAFAKLDENKDGKLTADEAGAAGGGHGHMHGRGPAAGGSSQTPAAGRGGRGGAGAGDEEAQARVPPVRVVAAVVAVDRLPAVLAVAGRPSQPVRQRAKGTPRVRLMSERLALFLKSPFAPRK